MPNISNVKMFSNSVNTLRSLGNGTMLVQDLPTKLVSRCRVLNTRHLSVSQNTFLKNCMILPIVLPVLVFKQQTLSDLLQSLPVIYLAHERRHISSIKRNPIHTKPHTTTGQSLIISHWFIHLLLKIYFKTLNHH